jgi:hypothetical protein
MKTKILELLGFKSKMVLLLSSLLLFPSSLPLLLFLSFTLLSYLILYTLAEL